MAKDKDKSSRNGLRPVQWVGLGVLVLIVLAMIPGYRLGTYYLGRAIDSDAVLLVPTGSDFATLIDSLESKKVLHNPKRFERWARSRGLDSSINPGRYQLKAGTSYASLINVLKSGRQTPVRVTFNNLRTPERLAGVLARKLEPDSLTWIKALTSDSLAKPYGLTSQTLFTLFIPNTYEFYWNTTPEAFLQRMKKESDRFWASRESKLARCGLSREEIYTLASIVYEETKRVAEMPRVAGVYLNRLRIGMALQADPTVKYAVKDFTLRRILHSHLEVDSRYNTYKYPGLPPGPICMPSIDAIDAVLDYEDHDYLYFCAKDDLSGAHVFARTLDEHNRNARAYARALNRRGIR